jgi:putative transposase
MPNYRRPRHPGGLYFFTVNLAERKGNDLLVRHIDRLRECVRSVRQRHPFGIHAWVVLPDHLHCILEMPADDADFSRRWRLIKAGFSRSLPELGTPSPSCSRRGERGIWQRRFWEHHIRNEDDYRAHMDYVHINPVKHGLVPSVRDWPYSTFHRLAEQGMYAAEWAGSKASDEVDCPD